jgi:hypothetical protein
MDQLPTLARNTWGGPPPAELENHVIDVVADLISRVSFKLEKKYSLKWLQAALENALRKGQQPLTDYAIYAAERGDEICDTALRTVFAEMVGGMFPPEQRRPGHLQIWAYGQRAVRRTPHKRPRGHRWHDDWMGNIQLCMLVVFVCREFGVPAAHNQKDPGIRRAPSGISIVVAALARAGIKSRGLNEKSMQRNIWYGLPGELVRTITPMLDFERATSESARNEANRKAAVQRPGLDQLRRRLLSGPSRVAPDRASRTYLCDK